MAKIKLTDPKFYGYVGSIVEAAIDDDGDAVLDNDENGYIYAFKGQYEIVTDTGGGLGVVDTDLGIKTLEIKASDVVVNSYTIIFNVETVAELQDVLSGLDYVSLEKVQVISNIRT